MALNEEYLQRACEAFDAATGQPRNAVAAAIEAYLTEMFEPGQVQMLAVGAIEHVVDAGRELQLVAETIAGIQRKRGEARTASKIATHHVALVQRHPILRRHRAQ